MDTKLETNMLQHTHTQAGIMLAWQEKGEGRGWCFESLPLTDM